MRVKTVVDLGSQEIEVDIDGLDVVHAMLGETEGWTPEQLIKRALSNVASFLRRLTPEQIQNLTPAARKVTHDFCLEQVGRFGDEQTPEGRIAELESQLEKLQTQLQGLREAKEAADRGAASAKDLEARYRVATQNLETVSVSGREWAVRAESAETTLAGLRDAAVCVRDRFKADLEQGYRTKDKEFAVSVLSQALSQMEQPQVSSAELFYIQAKGFCGNSLRWWKEGGHGYTSDLNEAWRVTREQAESIVRDRRREDMMWPVAFVEANAQRHATESILGRNPLNQGLGLI